MRIVTAKYLVICFILSLILGQISCDKGEEDLSMADCPSPPAWCIGTWLIDDVSSGRPFIRIETDDLVLLDVFTETSAKGLARPGISHFNQIVKTENDYEVHLVTPSIGDSFKYVFSYVDETNIKFQGADLSRQ